MGEAEAIAMVSRPGTVKSIVADLRALGVQPGMTLLVHSSLSALGWVCGGPVAVIFALEEVLGPEGTLMVPTHSGDLSDPEEWQAPPVPESWWAEIRESMPAYDPVLTPTREMGAIPETFRRQRGILRSAHPQGSFAARGVHAAQLIEGHSLDYAFGEQSPLARLYDLDGWVLLLGVGHGNNTSLHLAEYRSPYATREIVRKGAPILIDGARHWIQYDDINSDADDFVALGADFTRDTGEVRSGAVAGGWGLLFRQRPLVDYGVGWIAAHR